MITPRTGARIAALAALAAGLSPWRSAQPDIAPPSVWVRHAGFEALRKGAPADGGANLYVSRKGRLQTINRWDLDNDGELDLLFTQDHDSVYTPDSLIYWGGPEGYHSLLPDMWQLRAPFSLLGSLRAALGRVTLLPTAGGGRAHIADLNGDGFPDIVLCNFMHNYRPDQPAYIYWGGPAGFHVAARTELPAFLAGGVAVTDLNGDGRPEVVLANRGDELGENRGFRFHLESYIYWGSVTGYSAAGRTALPTVSAADVAAGDFNGDGAIDLAFVNSNSREQSVFVYWGDRSGRMDAGRRQVIGGGGLRIPPKVAGRYPEAMKTLRAADLNSDRISDLVVCGTSHAAVFRGKADGLAPLTYLPAKNCMGADAADLNGDGHWDLVLANEGAAVSAIYWGAAGQYDAARRTELPTLHATTVNAADLNSDGYRDLLFGNSQDGRRADVPSYIYWGGSEGYRPYRRTDLFAFGVAGSAVADLNRDGRPDILLPGHLSGRTTVLPTAIYWGNAEHHYSSVGTTLLEPGGEMEYSIADLDDDGRADLVLLHGPKPVAVWWGSADGYTAAHRSELPVRNAISSSVADLDRDGALDLVFTTPAGPADAGAGVVLLYGDGGRFRDPRQARFTLAGRATEANTIADLNRDGWLDLLFPLGLTGQSEIWYGGPGGYRPENSQRIEAQGAPHAAVADFDRDGWLDAVFTSGAVPGTASVNLKTYIYWGSPNGFTAAARTALDSYTSLDAAIADFNRDGHLDLAITNYKSDTTRDLPAFIYWGDGKRGFTEKRRTLLDAQSSSAIDALDLNRDGWVDLAVSNHQVNFDHAAGTNIYWGGKEGFSIARRTHLPTVGVHLDSMAEAGNIYTREYRWDYVSDPLEAPPDAHFSRLHWKAETGAGTRVRFQVRTAPDRASLDSAEWAGPTGQGSFFEKSGAALSRTPRDHRWMQYRAVLESRDGGASPLLTEVALDCAR